MNALAEEKEALRKMVRAALKSLSVAEKSKNSPLACARLKSQPLWQSAKSIMFYAPLADELDVWPLLLEALAGGRRVFLPRFDATKNSYAACEIRDVQTDLRTGPFGIREPSPGCAEVPLKHLDLVLVPGIAFDADGRRLGRGRGYYDRLLHAHPGPACGVAFDEQIVQRIPVEPHDIKLDYIITPTRWQGGEQRAVLK
jgi:5-formyltetrahydrofolate cyclo-ligase